MQTNTEPRQTSVQLKSMQAVISTGYGGPEVLQVSQVPVPKQLDDEILVEIHATAVTAAHTLMRTGYPLFGRLFTGLIKPKMKISGTDFAGRIVAVGEKVGRYKVGDLVFGSTDLQGGCYAEYVCIKEDSVILKMPANLTFVEAAAINDGSTTAYAFLNHVIQLRSGQKILINGASGSIGTAAVQLSKLIGAEVTGICSTANIDLVESLGAKHVIDYTKNEVSQIDQKFDIIFDTVGKLSFGKCKHLLTKSGTFLTPVLSGQLFLDLLGNFFRRRKVKFAATGLRKKEEKLADFEEIKKLLASRKVHAIIDRTYHLDEIRAAHHYVDLGHKVGNVVIEVSSADA